jgi:hypothetical protein
MLWKAFGAVGLAAFCLCSPQAKADVFVLTNTTHPELYVFAPPIVWDGNGFVQAIPGGYKLTGPNTLGQVENTTTFVATALSDEVLSYDWVYQSFDSLDALFDPAGYVLDGVLTQLTHNQSRFVGSTTVPIIQTGTLTFNLHTGQTYGFYVHSTDSHEGAGVISFTTALAPAGVPEPATWTTLLLGFGVLGGLLRRARAQRNRSTAGVALIG